MNIETKRNKIMNFEKKNKIMNIETKSNKIMNLETKIIKILNDETKKKLCLLVSLSFSMSLFQSVCL